MLNYYQNFLVYRGEYYSVCFHAETKDSSSVHEYFECCDDVTQASLLFLVKTIADTGRIYDERKFRIEDRICLCAVLSSKRIIMKHVLDGLGCSF